MTSHSPRSHRSHRLGLLVAPVLLVAAGACAVACSDDDRPGNGSSSGTVTPFDGGGSSNDGAAPDAATITPRPDLCEGLELAGATIEELQLPGEAPPALGGEVAPGTYDLTELYAYAGDANPSDAGSEGEPPATRLTGNAARATVVVSRFEMRVIEARGTSQDGGLGAPTTRAVLYRVDGTDLVATAVCPTTALPVRIPFSTAGGGLALFRDATHREVYTPRPE